MKDEHEGPMSPMPSPEILREAMLYVCLSLLLFVSLCLCLRLSLFHLSDRVSGSPGWPQTSVQLRITSNSDRPMSAF